MGEWTFQRFNTRKPNQAVPAWTALVLVLATHSAFADAGSAQIDWLSMTMVLLGGLALFLFGMEQMSDGLKAVAGERMKLILARLTTNRFMGAITGALVTAVIQSSSVTTVLVVGFITAGLMSLSQSIGVIMGANIGTTITAQIVAFKVTTAAMPMIAIGFGMLFLAKRETIRHYGEMLMGLGLVFFGMTVMGDAMEPLRNYQPFLDLMIKMENPLLGIFVSLIFTALIQSSSATTGIVIVMATQGFITLPAGIALAFGANIGTCATALLAVIGKPREAVRAALVHVLFNVLGVLVWVGFIDNIAAWMSAFSPTYPELSGAARLGAEVPRQVANAHTFFNLANTVLFIGFASQFARVVEWLVPDRPGDEEPAVAAKFLDEALLATPSLALDRVSMEIGHMGERTGEMVEQIIDALITGNKDVLNRVAKLDDEVDFLHSHIVGYLGQIRKADLTQDQTAQIIDQLSVANDIENVGDLIETGLVSIGINRAQEAVQLEVGIRESLRRLHTEAANCFRLSLAGISNNDYAAALRVVERKELLSQLADQTGTVAAQYLESNATDKLVVYRLVVDAIEKLKRIYYFSKRIAKVALLAEQREGQAGEMAGKAGLGSVEG